MTRSLLLLIASLSLAACTGAPPPAEPPPAETAPETPPEPAPAPATTVAKIDVNVATDEALAAATGAGPRMVHEFEEYRPYRSILQFRKEIGKYVDEAKVAEYEQHLYVPIAINDSDVATVKQLPGVDAKEAQSLVDRRPYADVDAFVEALAPLVTEDELAVGKDWLRTP